MEHKRPRNQAAQAMYGSKIFSPKVGPTKRDRIAKRISKYRNNFNDRTP